MDVGNQASVNFHHSRARTYLYDFFYRGQVVLRAGTFFFSWGPGRHSYAAPGPQIWSWGANQVIVLLLNNVFNLALYTGVREHAVSIKTAVNCSPFGQTQK